MTVDLSAFTREARELAESLALGIVAVARRMLEDAELEARTAVAARLVEDPAPPSPVDAKPRKKRRKARAKRIVERDPKPAKRRPPRLAVVPAAPDVEDDAPVAPSKRDRFAEISARAAARA